MQSSKKKKGTIKHKPTVVKGQKPSKKKWNTKLERMTWLLVYVRCMMYVHGMFKDHDLKNCARIRLYDRILHTTTIYEKKIVKLLVVIFVHFEERFFFPSRYDLRLLIPETRDKMLLVIKMCDYYCKNVYGIIYFQMC